MALALALTGPALAEDAAHLIGDAARGADLFRQCAACHQVGPDAKNRTGPHLNDLFGRQAGSLEGARYSTAMQSAGAEGLVWDLDQLSVFVENPKALVPGTRMAFRGVADATDRNDLLAFLRQYSASPQDIPESAPTAVRDEVDLPPEVLAIVGDVAYGEYLASECLTCHQKDGSNDGIPGIIGWKTGDFVMAMHAYKRAIRPHPVMQMMAGRLSDEEIAALAAYFAELE